MWFYTGFVQYMFLNFMMDIVGFTAILIARMLSGLSQNHTPTYGYFSKQYDDLFQTRASSDMITGLCVPVIPLLLFAPVLLECANMLQVKIGICNENGVNAKVCRTTFTLKSHLPFGDIINCLPHGSLNVPIEHHPTIRYMVYNGYYKVMSNIPKMGHLPTPVPDHPHTNGARQVVPGGPAQRAGMRPGWISDAPSWPWKDLIVPISKIHGIYGYI